MRSACRREFAASPPRCYSGQAVTVECEYYPDGSFQTALAQYQLVQRKPASSQPPAKPMSFDAWMAARTERTHRQLIERTSIHLPQERRAQQIARCLGMTRD